MANLPLFASLPAETQPCPVRAALEDIDPESLSGRDALNLVYKLKELAAK